MSVRERRTAPTIQDLHFDLLLTVFARIGLRDLCTVEQGWYFLFCLVLVILNTLFR